MTADVSQTNLREPDAIDYDNYDESGVNKYAPPPEGRYLGRVPVITDESFAATGEGYLKVNVDPIEIVGEGPGRGYKVRFTSFSAKKYQKRNGSQIVDFLHACGLNLRPKTNAELKQALKMASGRTFQFQLIWEAYNKTTKESTKGVENFPTDDQGNPQPFVQDGFDAEKRWFANGRVRYTVSAVKNG